MAMININCEQMQLHVSDEIISVPCTAFASNYFDIVDHMDPTAYIFTGMINICLELDVT